MAVDVCVENATESDRRRCHFMDAMGAISILGNRLGRNLVVFAERANAGLGFLVWHMFASCFAIFCALGCGVSPGFHWYGLFYFGNSHLADWIKQ